MNKQRKADLLLVMVTGFWGASYFLTDLCLETMPPLSLNAFRFLVGFAVLAVAYLPRLRHISAKTWLYAVLIGAALTMVYVCYVYGIMHTSISNAGFICALPVIFTPLLELLLLRKRPGARFAAALVICTVGLALMTLNDTFRPALGDLLCLGTAFFYAVDLLITDRAVRDSDVDPLQLGVCQLGVVGVSMLVLTCLLEQPQLPSSPAAWGAALFLAVLCTGVAFVIQAVQQQYTSASHVGLIFTLEPLFSAVVAYFFAHEVLGLRGYIGAALMMLSLVLMEVDIMAIFRKKKENAPNLPIPTHLQSYLVPSGSKNDHRTVSGTIRCTCGGEDFTVSESNERAVVKLTCAHCGCEIDFFDAGKHGWDGFVDGMDLQDPTLPFLPVSCSGCGKSHHRLSVTIRACSEDDFWREAVSQAENLSMADRADAFEWIAATLTCAHCGREDKLWLNWETM